MSVYSEVDDALRTIDAHIERQERQVADLREQLRLAEEKVGVAEAIRQRARLWDAVVANLKREHDPQSRVTTFHTEFTFSCKVLDDELASEAYPGVIGDRVLFSLERSLKEWVNRVLGA